MAPTTAQLQSFLNARSRLYGQAFKNRDAEAISAWHAKDIVFNDISMDELLMTKAQFHAMISQTTGAMRSLNILEDRTSGADPYFTAWEQLIEIEYGVDEPVMGIKKGAKTYIRGCSLVWWRWDGEDADEQYLGIDDEEKIRGWKIVREHDYMVVLKEGAEAERERLFDGAGGMRGRKEE